MLTIFKAKNRIDRLRARYQKAINNLVRHSHNRTITLERAMICRQKAVHLMGFIAEENSNFYKRGDSEW